jgi:hypothetical protein
MRQACIDEEELPVSAYLKVIRESDPDYGMTQDEVMDRNEFIRCVILKGFETLRMIPMQTFENDFFVEDWQESAFNTQDFLRLHPQAPFNKYAYKIKKVMEKVKDLAIYHSCISSPQGRKNVWMRYKSLVESEFEGRAKFLSHKLQNTKTQAQREQINGRILELNKRIMQCKKIWEQYAPWDT